MSESDRWVDDPDALWLNGRNLEPIIQQMAGALRAAVCVHPEGDAVINTRAVEHWHSKLRDMIADAKQR